VAGTGVQGYSGDGGPATKAMMGEPRGLTVAPDGSILFCDYQNYRIRRITPDGIVRTFAGNGIDIGMNAGDGGPALQARIRYCSDISIGKDGTVFFNSSEVVRGVATDGYIKTIAGVAIHPGWKMARQLQPNLDMKLTFFMGRTIISMSVNGHGQTIRRVPASLKLRRRFPALH